MAATRNSEAVRYLLERIFDDDWEEVLSILDPDFILDFSRSRNPDLAGVHHGPEAAKTIVTGFGSSFTDLRFDVEEASDLDEQTVLAVATVHGKGLSSGVQIAGTGSHLWRFSNGTPVRFALYQSKAEALAAYAGGEGE